MVRNDDGCGCDAVCMFFGDCCVDYEYWCTDGLGRDGERAVGDRPSSPRPLVSDRANTLDDSPTLRPLVDPEFQLTTQQIESRFMKFHETKCRPLLVGYNGEMISLRLVDECPSIVDQNDTNYEELARKCRHSRRGINASSLLYITPVKDSKAVFGNRFCARCFQRYANYVESVETFTPKIQCLDEAAQRRILEYLRAGGKEDFLHAASEECVVYFKLPASYYQWADNARFVCSGETHIVSDCNKPNTDLLKQACSVYRAPVEIDSRLRKIQFPNATKPVGFVNMACAECWGITDTELLSCFVSGFGLTGRGTINRRDPIITKLPSFTLLLDFSENSKHDFNVKLGEDIICAADQLFDVMNGICLKNNCSVGEVSVYGVCVRLDRGVLGSLRPDVDGTQTINVLVRLSFEVNDSSDEEAIMSRFQMSTSYINLDDKLNQRQTTLTYEIMTCDRFNLTLLVNKVPWSEGDESAQSVMLSYCLLVTFSLKATDAGSFQTDYIEQWQHSTERLLTRFVAMFSRLPEAYLAHLSITWANHNIKHPDFACPADSKMAPRTGVQIVKDHNDTFRMVVKDTGLIVVDITSIPMLVTSVYDGSRSSSVSITTSTTVLAYLCEANLLTCPKSVMSLANVSYSLYNNTLMVSVRGQKVQLTPNSFILLNNTLVYCSDADSVANVAGTSTKPPLVDVVERLMTFVAITLSLVSLGATLLTYSLLPSLRNTPGKCTMNLCVAIFLAQLLFISNLSFRHLPLLCKAVAGGQHYFWLAAFTWMTLLAADICNSFVNMSPSQRTVSARFRAYLVCGWVLPLVIVVCCLVIDLGTTLDFAYGSDDACWLDGSPLILVIVFAMPIAISLVTNSVLFLITVVSLRRTMKIAQRATNKKDVNKQIKICLKLSSIMGFSWLFGFLASWPPLWFMAFPFIILNTLQGLFLFWAFVANRRVLGMYKARFRLQKYLANPSASTSSIMMTSVIRNESGMYKN